jgi:hypothetical protein
VIYLNKVLHIWIAVSGREIIIHPAQQKNINEISQAVLRMPYWLNGNRSSVSQQFVLP